MATHWGAHPLGDGRWRFGLWAPDAEEARLEVGGTALPAHSAGHGWWLFEGEATAGDAYRWVMEGTPYPDPAARAQIGDVHGPSMLVDPAAYQWRHEWPGRPWHEAVVYELHLGTFTEEGTFAAAIAELPRLADLGVTMIEIMPVAQFEGDRGWGYDGVLPFAPHPAYGTPDEMRALVDAAHSHGIAVMLDVVYNHFGPSGNYLGAWCPSFFHPERASPWGAGIAFEAPAVREYFIADALHWLDEYRLDGLRLDAVHAIEDHSETHFLDELAARIRACDFGRPIHLVTEDERNLVRYFTADAPYDGTWNDDWHHAVHCLLTGEDESYYAPFAVAPVADIATALADGYVEQGQ
ncbi:malto-oligosyltrehalose trehalohydrolase, partial [Sphingomonas sp. LH128]|uniref:alpha-amylase family glycosyl hydrolase n=1 Tax=Sphingomonas sp. LH128 TaxID=473781 RepID=UPI00027CB25D